MLQGMLQDVRYAGRTALKTPGFTTVVILTLALGIGACTFVFSMVYGLMFRPFPFDVDGRLVVVWETNATRGIEETECSYGNFVDWREQSNSFEAFCAYRYDGLNLAGADGPVRVRAIKASADVFRVFGIQAVAGRVFNEQEDRPGADGVVLVSDAFWRAQLGTDPGVIGRDLTLDGDVHRVVGVMPSDFDPGKRMLTPVDVWLPLAREYDRSDGNAAELRDDRDLSVVGRRRTDVTLLEMRTELAGIAERLQETYPDSNTGWGVRIETAPMARLGDGGELALKFLSLAVAFVLLMACFNVANLLLARVATRGKEVALRAALGARRGRIVRQLLTESTLVAVIAGGLGVVVAFWSKQAVFALSAEAGAYDASNHPVQVDAFALAFALFAALATVVIFGLLPALQASRCDLAGALKDGSRTASSGKRGHRLRSALVASEIALAVVLVVSTSLVVQSLIQLQRLDPGYDPHGLLAANISLSEKAHADQSQRSAFFSRALAEIDRLPQVTTVAASDSPPLSSAPTKALSIKGLPPGERDRQPETAVSTVTATYWLTMGIPFAAGRAFAGSDDSKAPLVAVINETLVRRHWPNEDPLGQPIKFGKYDDPASPWRTIVGVVRDTRRWTQVYEAQPQAYIPYEQNPMTDMAILVRTTLDKPTVLAGAVSQAVRRVDSDQPVFDLRGIEEEYDLQFSSWRIFTGLLSAFSIVALLLAAIGTYGAMSYMMSRRTQEIGVRMAMGAQVQDVLRLMLRQGALLTFLGIGMGIPCAIAVAFILSNMLYRVTATDVPTLIGVSLLLGGVALVACYVPARRATKADPMVALRHE
ncbi:MAG: ABC transporter permease [Phycisphaerae bacterium]